MYKYCNKIPTYAPYSIYLRGAIGFKVASWQPVVSNVGVQIMRRALFWVVELGKVILLL